MKYLLKSSNPLNFEVLAKEHSIVLFSLLETFDGFNGYSFDLLLDSKELLVLLHIQLPFSPEVVTESLGLFLDEV